MTVHNGDLPARQLFINGRELSEAQPVETFTAIIDEELDQAK
jgi:hypothetical protein